MTNIAKRRLGTTDMDITRVGFGAWAISGADWKWGWGATDDADSIRAMRHAFESGVNWIDTAAAYGNGHSEELVGRTIKQLPESDRPYVFTKAGLIWETGNPFDSPRKIITRESLRTEVENSLRRLDVERIDLYQVHWPVDGRTFDWGGAGGDDAVPVPSIEEYWGYMNELKEEGKVRAVGLSNHSSAQMALAEKVAHVDASQPQFSALERSSAEDNAWAGANGTGVIVYSPMASGLLTGAFTAERVASLPDNDWRKASADYTDRLPRNLAVAEALRTVAERHGVPVASAAVAWALAWPGVTGAIVGARKESQVDGWLPGANLELTAEDLAEVAAAIEANGAGSGPIRP